MRIAGATTDWKFDGNTMIDAVGTGIYVTTNGSIGSISNNDFTSGVSSIKAIWLAGSGGNITITNNEINYSGSSSIGIYNQALSASANSDTITGNELNGKSTDSTP